VAATVVDLTGQGRSIAGSVKNDRGEPLQGATVIARTADSSPDARRATTDDQGLFELVGQAGSWTLTAEKLGFEPGFLDVDVQPLPAPNPTLTLTLKAAAPEASPTGKDLQQLLTEADALFNLKRFDDAISAYRRILVKAPALSVVNLQIAAVYTSKREFARALAAYGDMLKADPANVNAMIGIAMTELAKGDLESAERALESAAQTAGATREVFYNLGEMKLSRSKTAEAFQAYRRAADIDPTWGMPFLAMGRIAKDAGDLASALRYFAKVIELDPASPEAAAAKTAIRQLRK
jgi:tetratricopeptide (TPR) repeat protein